MSFVVAILTKCAKEHTFARCFIILYADGLGARRATVYRLARPLCIAILYTEGRRMRSMTYQIVLGSG